MLAYSSVEHMGILALGVGLGGAAVFGSMLHAVNHSLTKATLFMVAGNILAAYKTKTANEVRGVLAVIPISGLLWVAGILAITGFPPFGTFLSEFVILKAGIDQERYFIAAAYIVLLAVIFIGISAIAFRMPQGHISPVYPQKERFLSIVPPAILILGVLAFGIYIPKHLNVCLHGIASMLGGN